jgi:hypothetical protein
MVGVSLRLFDDFGWSVIRVGHARGVPGSAARNPG